MPHWTDAATETTNGGGCETSRRRSRRRSRYRRRCRDARRAVNVVRVRARCVGVGLVYRAPVAAATKAARAGGYAVLARRTVPGDALYGERVEGAKKAQAAATRPAFSLVLVRIPVCPCLYRRRVCLRFSPPRRVCYNRRSVTSRHFEDISSTLPPLQEPVQGW